MQIYLDYNATAPLMRAARDAVVAGLDMRNASSIHQFGRSARNAVTHARGILATYLSVRPAQIIFTSSATEATVTALRGVGAQSFIMSAVEHEAVRETVKKISPLPAERGWPEGPGEGDVTFGTFPVNPDGIINLATLEHFLKTSASPTLVAIQYANNETGVIQPIADIIRLAKQHNAMTMIDAVQALGRIPLDGLQGADIIILSPHKFGGPKGVGALVLREGLSITPLLTGGGQEERRRAGTENVAAIMGFGAAIENISISLDHQSNLAAWRQKMEEDVRAALPQAQFFGQNVLRLGNTSMLALPGITAATQLMNLDLSGIAVSSGSACSSGKVGASHVLLAMGVPPDVAACAIRVSGGWDTTEQDFIQLTKTYIEMARRLN